MELAAAALVALALVLAAVLAIGRPPPAPWPAARPCQSSADCPLGSACLVGGCIDVELPPLIRGAQSTAAALFAALVAQAVALETAYADAVALYNTAAASNFITSPLCPYANDLGRAQGALGNLMAGLRAPGCNPAVSSGCGYYAQVMTLTPATPGGVIIATAGAAAPAAETIAGNAQSLAATLSVAAADAATILNFLSADSQRQGRALDSATAAAVAVIRADMAAMTAFAVPGGPFVSGAADMAQSGAALLQHLVSSWKPSTAPSASSGILAN
jgi:hypothetical protein